MRRDSRSRTERRPHGAGSLLVLWALASLLPTGTALAQAPADTVTLAWTAPGDDGTVGIATAYEMRVSQSPIDESNWGGATPVTGAPAPAPAGARQSMVVRGLTNGTTYYFAIKTVDDAGNWSGISNLVRWDWVLDTAPPSAPSGLTAVLASGGGVHLSWTPNSEADLAGYVVYRSLAAGGPYSVVSGALISASFDDASVPAGTSVAWYQVSAKDVSGNESARSGVVSITLVAQAPSWTLSPGYPNPSGSGVTVRMPLLVGGSGGEARVEIVNNVGQRVRRIDLGTLASGSTTEVQWDGRNDAGREVAPGAYTAWLTAGSTRTSVRLVRVP